MIVLARIGSYFCRFFLAKLNNVMLDYVYSRTHKCT